MRSTSSLQTVSLPPDDEPEAKINERAIYQFLVSETHAISAEQLRSLVGMAMLAAHERKVTREAMIDVLNDATTIMSTLGGLEAVVFNIQAFEAVGHDATKMKEIADYYVQQLTNERRRLAEKVALLRECAPPGTKLS
jgi:hypothetical protein